MSNILITSDGFIWVLLSYEDALFAFENGQESELIADWQEATTRNNEKRSFMAWLEDKAENLLS